MVLVAMPGPSLAQYNNSVQFLDVPSTPGYVTGGVANLPPSEAAVYRSLTSNPSSLTNPARNYTFSSGGINVLTWLATLGWTSPEGENPCTASVTP